MASDPGRRPVRRPIVVTVGLVIALLVGSACVSPPPSDDFAGLGTTPMTLPLDPRSATVRIRSETCEGVGVGSGFLLDQHTIITNRHVVKGATKLSVETYEGTMLEVDVASQGRLADLAVLKIKSGIGQSASLAKRDPAVGTHIRAFGYAGGGPMRVTEGRITGFIEDKDLGNSRPVMTATVEIRPGNSGGPALDDEGDVIGVVYAIELRSKLAMIIPLSTLQGVLKDKALLKPVAPC